MSNNSNNWKLDFINLSDQATRFTSPPGFATSVAAITSSTSSSKGNLKNKKDGQQVVPSEKDQEKLKIKKAWDAALSPGKNIPMNAFMLWMSGNGVQIFSVMITGMLLFQPIKALMGIDSVFERYESSKTKSQLLLPKLVYVILQILTMLLGLYKCSSMGLLPTAASDWLAFMDPKQILEYSVIY